jgi:hypothetical protein
MFLILTLLCILGATFTLTLGVPFAWQHRGKPFEPGSGSARQERGLVLPVFLTGLAFVGGALGCYRAHVRFRDKVS